MSTRKRSKCPGNPNLSEDVILEILLRLPVKILLRCKCVCKQWYIIIESRSFLKEHLGHRSNQERLLVPYYKRNENLRAFALFVDDNCSGFEEPAHLQIPNMISELLGPVNGVFCLVGDSSDLALLNPSMRQLKPLPKLSWVIGGPDLLFWDWDNVLGFGLDPLSGDYKVVSIWYSKANAPDCNTVIFVYSLGSDSWRVLEDVGCFQSGYSACRSRCNTYLNGVYYWTIEQISKFTVSAVLAFDMVTEKFQEIQVPNCLKSKVGHLTIIQ